MSEMNRRLAGILAGDVVGYSAMVAADMFLHFTDLVASDIDPESIKIGVRLTFEIGSTRDDRPKAINVRIA